MAALTHKIKRQQEIEGLKNILVRRGWEIRDGVRDVDFVACKGRQRWLVKARFSGDKFVPTEWKRIWKVTSKEGGRYWEADRTRVGWCLLDLTKILRVWVRWWSIRDMVSLFTVLRIWAILGDNVGITTAYWIEDNGRVMKRFTDSLWEYFIWPEHLKRLI